MSKIRLDLDRLQVETFEPEARGPVLRGTVKAHERTPWEPCIATATRGLVYTTCDQPTYGLSCGRTCLCQATNDCTTAGCVTADCVTTDCATQDLGDRTCGLSCNGSLCNPTLQLIACTG